MRLDTITPVAEELWLQAGIDFWNDVQTGKTWFRDQETADKVFALLQV